MRKRLKVFESEFYEQRRTKITTKKLAVWYRWEEDGSCTFFTPDGREVVQSPEAAEEFIARLNLSLLSISKG
jgi:hypothetical protein